MRAEISALRTKRSKLSGKKNVKARKKIGRRIQDMEEALASVAQEEAGKAARNAQQEDQAQWALHMNAWAPYGAITSWGWKAWSPPSSRTRCRGLLQVAQMRLLVAMLPSALHATPDVRECCPLIATLFKNFIFEVRYPKRTRH